jgi:tetratricopeptide (TPR) repeat protein
MYCPECGFDAGDAKFCPECGTELENVRKAARRAAAAPRPPRDPGLPPRRSAPRSSTMGVRPLYLWIAVAVVPVVVIVAMLVLASHRSATGSAAPVADTSGSYQQLVLRANKHFDQGKPYIDQGNFTAAAPYFVAAAKEYDAAWSQQSTDPAVGADYATSLFYAGDVQGAIGMVNTVLKLKPTGGVLQKALLNKGNFLAMAGRVATQNGQTARSKQLFAEAYASYRASIKVDPASDVVALDRRGIADILTTLAPSTAP